MGEWSEDDSTTSGESAMIFTEATETIEPQENPEEEWTTPQNMVSMVKHAQLHWLGCFDQACQTHRYKEYNVLPQGQEYRCQGKEKISWKECTNDSCKGHVKPKVRYHWFPQAIQKNAMHQTTTYAETLPAQCISPENGKVEYSQEEIW